jgi:hypothetical protein
VLIGENGSQGSCAEAYPEHIASGLPSTADMARTSREVRSVPEADIFQ